jgi:secreted trypsin-like serine protease
MIGSAIRSEPGEVHEISEIFTDPNSISDSALLKMATTTAIEPIRIADAATEQSRWAPGKVATTIGWGTEMFLGSCCPDHLKEVEVPVVSDAECARLNQFLGFNGPTEVCAGELTGGKDACQGDSGGPIIVPDATGDWIVFGTTFYGLGCGYPGGAYGVYAEVGSNPIQGWLNSVLPPESSLSAEDGAGTEGGSAAVTVRRAGTTRKTVTVDFATVDGTATSGSDFWGMAGTLVFEPGDRTQRILIPLFGDGEAEGNETFTVQLSSPVHAEITAATATVTIAD